MAAITYWVDPVNGDNLNDGLSFANAFQTHVALIDAIQAAGNGNDYTINLVNTGTHPHTNNAGINQIDGQTTSTFLVRGTDSSGNPTLAHVEPDGTATVVTSPFLYIRENAGITVEYIDWQGIDGTTYANSFIYNRDSNPNPATIEFRFCRFRRQSISTARTTSGGFRPVTLGSSTRASIYVHDCYFQGVSNAIFAGTFPNDDGTTTMRFERNVFVDNYEGGVSSRVVNVSFALQIPLSIKNNTYYSINQDAASPALPTFMQDGPFSGTQTNLDIQNNVVWIDQQTPGGSYTSGGFIIGSTTGTSVLDGDSEIGNNVYYVGPLAGAKDLSAVDTYDGAPFVPDGGGGLYVGDQRFEDVADTVLFNDPTATYDWTPTGSALSLTIAKDLRILRELSAGVGGTIPGALPAATTDYTASASTDKANPNEGETVTLTLGMANSGTDSTDVENTITGLTGLTIVTATLSQGTYDQGTGVWAMGDLNDGASGTLVLVCTVDAGTGGTTITPQIAWTDGLPTGGNLSDDTASVALNVVADTPGDITAPSAVPFIDVLPINATELLLQYNVSIQTKRNRIRKDYLRSDVEGQRWRECNLRRLELGTNTTTQLNLGGIQRGQFLMVESTTQIDVSVGNSTNLYIPAKVVILSDGDFETVTLRNQSTTVSATVIYGVTD